MTIMIRKFLAAAIALLCVLAPCAAGAKDIYLDPAASAGGDGSKGRPFGSFDTAFSAKPEPGTRFILKDGFYGALVLRNVQGLVVEGKAGGAVLSSILVQGSSDVVLKSLTVDWSLGEGGGRGAKVPPGAGVAVQVAGTAVTVENVIIRSAANGADWSELEWRANAASGISARGDGMVIRNNRLTYIRHGIQLVGSKGVIDGNEIAHFSGDGMRAIGDFNLVQDNFVHSCYRVDDNHDDGFQSWTVGADGRSGTGVSRGTVLRRNRIFSYLEPGHPLQCRLQGIGMFDGIYEDWLIENNLVVVDHWHGITVMGAKGVVIRNNTIFDPVDNRVGPAAVRILPHKDKRQPVGSEIANNLVPGKAAAVSKGFPKVQDGVDVRGNVYYGNPRNVFRDPEEFDLRPHAKSFGNDYAKGEVPGDDISGQPRPWGKRADVGAYEYRGE